MKYNDVVFEILKAMLTQSPEKSYARLNTALRITLNECISADLPFRYNTFERIYNELRGVMWFMHGSGSHAGEHYYTQAVECNHASAIQSFENWSGRPGVLWEETTRTPMRLHVGAKFTWNGCYVTVTSMRKDSLVACTYKGHRSSVAGLKPGATFYLDKEWMITGAKRHGKATILTVVENPASQGDTQVLKRFVIPYSELQQFRRTEAKRVKAITDQIAKVKSVRDGKQIAQRVNTSHFRHFQLEIINAAFNQRMKELEAIKADRARTLETKRRTAEVEELQRTEPARIESWKSGRDGAWLNARGIYLRVKNDLVECSNGNSVSVASARAVLPVLLEHRAKAAKLALPVDGHTVHLVTPDKVTVGCTTVPWSEIDRIRPQLEKEE